jgi:hypothetical protein
VRREKRPPPLTEFGSECTEWGEVDGAPSTLKRIANGVFGEPRLAAARRHLEDAVEACRHQTGGENLVLCGSDLPVVDGLTTHAYSMRGREIKGKIMRESGQ